MAQYRDILPSQNGWVHELARAEIHPNAEELLNLNSSFDPRQLVEESTIDFLTELRSQMTDFTRAFNHYAENAQFQEVKVYAVAQSPADFMLFRNQMKLVVSNSAHGVILIEFLNHANHAYSGDSADLQGSPGAKIKPQELLAQVGPFRNVYWTFQGEKVRPSEVAKFYFAEFVRATRDVKTRESSHQLLLDQIKSLLNEKGLNL